MKSLIKKLHLVMDGDRDRDPHWSTGLTSQGPDEEQKEVEHEQGSQNIRLFTLLSNIRNTVYIFFATPFKTCSPVILD